MTSYDTDELINVDVDEIECSDLGHEIAKMIGKSSH